MFLKSSHWELNCLSFLEQSCLNKNALITDQRTPSSWFAHKDLFSCWKPSWAQALCTFFNLLCLLLYISYACICNIHILEKTLPHFMLIWRLLWDLLWRCLSISCNVIISPPGVFSGLSITHFRLVAFVLPFNHLVTSVNSVNIPVFLAGTLRTLFLFKRHNCFFVFFNYYLKPWDFFESSLKTRQQLAVQDTANTGQDVGGHGSLT